MSRFVRDLRRHTRAGVSRATTVAATRYRDAVLEHSPWLPAYLTAVDLADTAVRASRAARGKRRANPWSEPGPEQAAVARAGLSGAGELSLALTGPQAWRSSVAGVILHSGTERLPLGGGLLERAGSTLQICMPLTELACGSWRVALSGPDGGALPLPPVACGAVRATALDGPNRLVADDTGLVVERSPAERSVAHRIVIGIARLTLDWTPPPGSPAELVLLDPDGQVAARIAGTTATGEFELTAVIDAVPIDHAVLRVAAPSGDVAVPLGFAPGTYPGAAAAHGVARPGGVPVRVGYDTAHRLTLRLGP